MNERVWHYLKPNETTRVPRSLIVLDTEARTERRPWGHEQTWRCAAAWFAKGRKGRPVKASMAEFWSPVELWEAIVDHCGRRERTVLWAHNIGYDARIADAFTLLPRMGWRLIAHNMVPRGTWMVWRCEDATLTMVDSGSVWPLDLAMIAKLFGMGKTPLPDQDAPDREWMDRCVRDVEILATAVTQYLTWIEGADLGNWQLTGAGQSWAAFRHRHLTHRMLIHADPDALEAERTAMWTGRCEAYWHGTILRQEVDEWDLSLAYARAAQRHPVPVRLIGPVGPRFNWRNVMGQAGTALLAEVAITTDRPVVPTRRDGRILWPVGSFTTTVWEPELALLQEAGARVRLMRGWMYRTAPALNSWATWIIDALAAPDDVVPAWQKVIFKHWARALVGRFAMSYSTWEELAVLAEPGIDRRVCVDLDQQTTYELMQVGHDLWQSTGVEEWANSMPMVTSYIMSLVRAQLWQILTQLPDDAPLYVDTDSILATDRHRAVIDAVTRTPVGAGLRLKRTWRGIQILGPRQIITGDLVRFAGMPKGAQRVGRNEFTGEVWESLPRSLATGLPSTVRTLDRVWRPQGRDRRRQGAGVGWTRPIELLEVAG